MWMIVLTIKTNTVESTIGSTRAVNGTMISISFHDQPLSISQRRWLVG